MPSTRYSVVIPSHNRPDMLKRALGSIFNQSLPPHEVLLVIDEPENWGKYGFLRDYDDTLLKIAFTGGGKGGAGARNIGLDQVTGDYVFFLDDDDEWMPEKCEKQIELLLSDYNYVGVACWRVVCRSDGRQYITRIYENFVNRHIKIKNTIGSFSFFGYKINEFTKNIRLDEHLKSAQDLEFYMRIADCGKIGISRNILARYHSHDGVRITGDVRKKYNSLLYIYNKHFSSLSFCDRCFWHSKVLIYESKLLSRGMKRAPLVIKAVLLCILAFKPFRISFQILKKAYT